jgi:hypothetical protein
MTKELINLFIFIGICFIAYILFRNLNFKINTKEGMTSAPTASSSSSSSSSASNGVAGNAAAYGATLQAATVKQQDIYLISKYRSDYETVILNLDDLVNNLMLGAALNVNPNNPQESLSKLAQLNQSKTALNNIMTFIDKSS